MFFRRVTPRVPALEERLEGLKQSGFAISSQASGETRVSRGECAALVCRNTRGETELVHPGILVNGEIGVIVDGGNQKFLVTPSGRRRPALAKHLRALHAFTEDLREGLGMVSLYNESLGTVNELHHYDRVKGRE